MVFGANWHWLLLDNNRCRLVLILEERKGGYQDNYRHILCVCCSVRVVTISMDKGYSAKVNVLVVHSKPLEFNLLLGFNTLQALRGIVVGPTQSVKISNGKVPVCSHLHQ